MTGRLVPILTWTNGLAMFSDRSKAFITLTRPPERNPSSASIIHSCPSTSTAFHPYHLPSLSPSSSCSPFACGCLRFLLCLRLQVHFTSSSASSSGEYPGHLFLHYAPAAALLARTEPHPEPRGCAEKFLSSSSHLHRTAMRSATSLQLHYASRLLDPRRRINTAHHTVSLCAHHSPWHRHLRMHHQLLHSRSYNLTDSSV